MSLLVALSAAVFVNIGATTPGHAFDPEKTFSEDDEPRTILRFGFMALKKGNFDEAIGAFRFGAKKNDLASEWKLARMLQVGNGLPKDDLAAYELYSKIASRYNDKYPRRIDLPYVSNALVALGRYALNGIEGTRIKSNPRHAEDHFYRAAALYKDREAQFELGLMYRQGLLGVKQPKSAVRWFGLSARKGHQGAQAELGEMLFYGEGVRRSPVRGLVFMSKAMANSARNGANSIRQMRQKAFDKASAAQRKAADKIIDGLNRAAEAKDEVVRGSSGIANIGRVFDGNRQNNAGRRGDESRSRGGKQRGDK
ncbi:MAG: tetratricopeptide repeat protein [Rhizobiaceae bacterium]